MANGGKKGKVDGTEHKKQVESWMEKVYSRGKRKGLTAAVEKGESRESSGESGESK